MIKMMNKATRNEADMPYNIQTQEHPMSKADYTVKFEQHQLWHAF